MGYELHIVRQNDYENEEEESNITMDEWLNYVSSDNELKLSNGYTINIPGFETSWQNSPGFTEWISQSPHEDGSNIWFDYGCGSISAKYPESDTIRKMIAIALSLNAKVRGDDFEYYDETYFLP